MPDERSISPDLMARVDALAARTAMSREEIIRNALEHGRSLAWQEEWVRRVEEGRAAADRGEFATDEEMEAAFDRYRSG